MITIVSLVNAQDFLNKTQNSSRPKKEIINLTTLKVTTDAQQTPKTNVGNDTAPHVTCRNSYTCTQQYRYKGVQGGRWRQKIVNKLSRQGESQIAGHMSRAGRSHRMNGLVLQLT